MSWDQKPRGSETGYYYRTVRSGQKTTKVSVGRGPQAEDAARQDEEERQRRLTARQAWRAEQLRLAAADLALRDFRTLTGLLARATLLLAGLHQHHGEWRRRQ